MISDHLFVRFNIYRLYLLSVLEPREGWDRFTLHFDLEAGQTVYLGPQGLTKYEYFREERGVNIYFSLVILTQGTHKA